ncbi:hypothetical protein ID866_8903 [Astraeus odoratus]|nr:hypothetical protein ID866_8903 [Astraeus odoratus]
MSPVPPPNPIRNPIYPLLAMSWQGDFCSIHFVDKGLLEGGIIREAAILGLDGGVWAQSAGCNVSHEEQSAIIKGLKDPPLREISIGDRKYRCTMSTLDMIWGTARCEEGKGGGRGGCLIKKTNKAVIVAEYPPRSTHGDVMAGVEELGEYLIKKGY